MNITKQGVIIVDHPDCYGAGYHSWYLIGRSMIIIIKTSPSVERSAISGARRYWHRDF